MIPIMRSPRSPACAEMAELESQRLDKFLWFARIVKTRSQAQSLASEARLRISGRVAEKAHAAVRVGDVLSFALRGKIRILRIEALATRRGSPADARLLYSELTEGTLTSGGAGD